MMKIDKDLFKKKDNKPKDKKEHAGEKKATDYIRSAIQKKTFSETILLGVCVLAFLLVFIGASFIVFRNYTITLDLGNDSKPLVENYNIGSGDITLGIPQRKGYRFTGWTGSNGKKPKINVVISAGKIGNLKYKANWSNELHVSCQDWLVDKDGNLIKEITGEVDEFLKKGDSSKNYKVQDRTISVKAGTKARGAKWGKDSSYKAYSNQYIYIGDSGNKTIKYDETVVYRYFYPVLDVNYTVNGVSPSKLEMTNRDVAFFDLYIDGKLTKENVADYCYKAPYGSKYEIVFRRINPSYELEATNILTGLVGDSRLSLKLTFVDRQGEYSVTCSDWLIDKNGNKVREITSEVDTYLAAGKSKKKYPYMERTVLFDEGEFVSGEFWGNDTEVKIFHDSYVYVSSSDVTVTGDNMAVERYFYPVLDVGAYVNGKTKESTKNLAKFNVYVDGILAAENVTNYYEGVPCGSTYRVEITENTNWEYVHRSSPTDHAEMGAYKRELNLAFTERTGNYYVMVEDWVVDRNNNRIMEITETVDSFLQKSKSSNNNKVQNRAIRVSAGETIDPSLLGNDPDNKAYASDYVYAGASGTVTVEDSNVVVYRYFYPVLNVKVRVGEGKAKANASKIASYSVYIDGKYDVIGTTSYTGGVPYGSKYEIKFVKPKAKYNLVEGDYSGIMDENRATLEILFEKKVVEETPVEEDEDEVTAMPLSVGIGVGLRTGNMADDDDEDEDEDEAGVGTGVVTGTGTSVGTGTGTETGTSVEDGNANAAGDAAADNVDDAEEEDEEDEEDADVAAPDNAATGNADNSASGNTGAAAGADNGNADEEDEDEEDEEDVEDEIIEDIDDDGR